MMDKQHKCLKCFKVLSNRHNLHRHTKKSCMGRNHDSMDQNDDSPVAKKFKIANFLDEIINNKDTSPSKPSLEPIQTPTTLKKKVKYQNKIFDLSAKVKNTVDNGEDDDDNGNHNHHPKSLKDVYGKLVDSDDNINVLSPPQSCEDMDADEDEDDDDSNNDDNYDDDDGDEHEDDDDSDGDGDDVMVIDDSDNSDKSDNEKDDQQLKNGEKEEELSENEKLQRQIWKDIKSTANYLVRHDYKKVQKILQQFPKEEIVLKEKVRLFLNDEIYDKEDLLKEILQLLQQNDIIDKSTFIELEMLLKDIHENKVRVDRIINQFIHAGDDLKSRESAIKRLAQENLLSELQFFEIQENIDKMDVKKLFKIIKQSKIGQGVQFLPRLNSDLVHSLKDLLKTIASNKCGN